MLLPELADYIAESCRRFNLIDPARRTVLDKLASRMKDDIARGDRAKLIFICTHNSRRSQMAQLWAAAAAAHYGIDRIETYSGGTEATAFDHRAVAALVDTGFAIKKTSEADNPIYEVDYAENIESITAFSKVYDQAPNPDHGFYAVMTCSQADSNCPVVTGAAARFAIPYDDPKDFDGTDEESRAYADSCRRIATEMLYLFSKCH